MKDIIKLSASIIICLGAGFVGSIFTNPKIDTWYATIKKPAITPPDWVFAPVWTTLFILMGIAFYLVWRAGWSNPKVRTAMVIFLVQLIFNMLWSAVFFGLKAPLAAFFIIIALWLLILLTIILFAKVNKIAGVLLMPYILWVSFASVLNYKLWRLNI